MAELLYTHVHETPMVMLDAAAVLQALKLYVHTGHLLWRHQRKA